jgi:hypothetical protein
MDIDFQPLNSTQQFLRYIGGYPIPSKHETGVALLAKLYDNMVSDLHYEGIVRRRCLAAQLKNTAARSAFEFHVFFVLRIEGGIPKDEPHVDN